jgi:hypothetical protein
VGPDMSVTLKTVVAVLAASLMAVIVLELLA